jgi:hypothetical protein
MMKVTIEKDSTVKDADGTVLGNAGDTITVEDGLGQQLIDGRSAVRAEDHSATAEPDKPLRKKAAHKEE